MPKLKTRSPSQRIAANNEIKRRTRADSEKRIAEQADNTKSKQKARANTQKRKAEQAVNTLLHKNARANPLKRKAEQAVNTLLHKNARANPLKRKTEQAVNTLLHKNARANPLKRKAEQAVNTLLHKNARANPLKRKAEQAVDTLLHRKARANPLKKKVEQAANTKSKQKIRANPVKKKVEQAANTKSKQKIRANPVKKKVEQAANTKSKQKVRANPVTRKAEQAANTKSKQKSRTDPTKRKNERSLNSTARKRIRLDPVVQAKEQDARVHLRARRNLQYDFLLAEFKDKIKWSPEFICSCCGSLWYKTSVKTITKEELESKGFSPSDILKILSVPQQQHFLCGTCKRSVSRKAIPRLCLANGLKFPDIPDELKDLSPLEERLVSPRLPFMQVRLVGSQRQSKLLGNVINVECDLEKCAAILPREFNDTSTVQVQLMRRMRYTTPYMYEIIRPQKVLNAAKYLTQTDLYAEEGVTLSPNWTSNHPNEEEDFICNQNDYTTNSDMEVEEDCEEHINVEQDQNEEETQTGDLDIEDAHERSAEETLLFSEQDEVNQLRVRIAPAEGNTPLSLIRDENAEVLSFPTIYAGQKRKIPANINLSYTEIAKSELRNYERRACKPTKILYSFKRSFNEKVVQAIQICMRKSSGQTLTARRALDSAFLETIFKKDDGYAVFRHLRSSPSYWKEKQKKVLAMVRQLGKPAFFITFSAAETKWPELLVTLSKLQGQDITEEEARNLSHERIAELIRNDPVTCMRNFDHRFRAMMNILLKKEGGIFHPYKLADFFTRVEFQQRGSPHNHGMYWIEDAPVYNESDPNSIHQCIEFIDEFITTKRDMEDDMSSLIKYQLHRHSTTCKRPHVKCRFHFPLPPMDRTEILTPIPDTDTKRNKKEAANNYMRIKAYLEELGRDFEEDVPFDEFLEELDLTREEYIYAIRSSLSRNTILLKRSTNAIYINAYNKKLLQAWRANIDFQFILDTYACAKYCVGYITKSEGGMSKMLKRLKKDIRNGNVNAKNQIKKFGNILVNASEISTQEASGFLLGLDNTLCSRTDVFINTGPPEDRVSILKSKEALEKLDPGDDEVFQEGLLGHYTKRPEELNNICLAEFASLFDYSSKKSFSNKEPRVEDDDQPQQQQRIRGSKVYELFEESGYVKRRTKRKIIRYRNYGRARNPEQYFREQLMLFLPWINELEDLINVNCESLYNENEETIKQNCKPYIYNSDVQETHLYDLVTQAEDYMDEDDQPLLDTDMETLNEHIFTSDIADELTNYKSSKAEQFLPPKMLPDNEYKAIMRSLNRKQRKFVYDVLHIYKTSSKQFCKCLHGGAGVGKSRVITAIVQSLLRFSELFPSTTPDQTCVLVAAFTGKAAFNVFGMTLHCTFKLPPNQKSGNIAQLDDAALNTLRKILAHVKVFIIDEISMVSVKVIYWINQRLQQIFGNNKPFGGKSILVVGHFRQIPPIGGSLIFTPPTHLPMGDLTGNYLWEEFRLFELTEIMRQKGDYEFCKALNNLAEGPMDDEDIQLFKNCEVSPTHIPPENAIHLFFTNIQCREHNKEIHEAIRAKFGYDHCESIAYDMVQGRGSKSDKTKLLEEAAGWSLLDCNGLPHETSLQVGGEYFVSTNIDVQDGLFNGSTGELKKIVKSKTSGGKEIPTCVYMDFHTPLVGAHMRASSTAVIRGHGADQTWTPITRAKRTLNKRRKGLGVIRQQIPLIGANAMTFQKSQGCTYESGCVVHLDTGCRWKLSRQMLYMACSRATRKENLFIVGEFKPPEPLLPDDPVTLELERMRSIPYEFSLVFLQDIEPSFCKIYYHNIESFLSHKDDMLSDECCTCSNFTFLLEPQLLSTDELSIPGFNVLHRTNCSNNVRNSEGFLILGNESSTIPSLSKQQKHFRHGSTHCQITSMQVAQTLCIMIYKHPNFPNGLFLQNLNNFLQSLQPDQNLLLFGDINIDLSKADNCQFIDILNTFGLQSKLDLNVTTTNFQAHIDCCFSNMEYLQASIYESYYSYHKPLCIYWDPNLA